MITGKDGRALTTYAKTLERTVAGLLFNYINTTFEHECLKNPSEILEWRYRTADELCFIMGNSILVDYSNPKFKITESDLLRLQDAIFTEPIPETDAKVDEDGYVHRLSKEQDDVSCDVKAVDRMICNAIRNDLIQSVDDEFYHGLILDGYDIESEKHRQAIMAELNKPLKTLPRIAKALKARSEK